MGRRRDPRDVSPADFPREGGARDKILFLLRFAVQAPSFHNTQPWKFSVDRDRVGVLVDRARWLAFSDPDGRDLRLSVGCAIENLVAAARCFGYDPQVAYQPRATSPDLVAMVDLSRREPVSPRRLAAIEPLLGRRTGYPATDSRPVTPSVLDDMERACGSDDAQLLFSREPGVRAAAAELFRRANAEQLADGNVRAEAADWMAQGEYGISRLVARAGRFALPHLERSLEREAGRIAAAPVLGVILTAADDPVARVKAGRALQRAWIAAATWKVSLRPASAICALPATREQLARIVDARPGACAQIAFRLGYGESEASRTGRRPVEAVTVAVPLG